MVMANFKEYAHKRLEINHGCNSKISSIEGLRALSVFMVFLVHYTSIIEPWIDVNAFGKKLYPLIHYYGNYGVELFFIISGYLIYSGVIKSNFEFSKYFTKRIRRIYPTFLVVLSIYASLSYIIKSESKLPTNIIDQFNYIILNMLLLPGVLDIKPIITVAWTLSYEMLFYMSLPLMVVFFRLRSLSGAERVTIYTLIIAFYWSYCFVENMPINRMSMFLFGIIAYEIKNHRIHINYATYFCFLIICLTIAVSAAYVNGFLAFNTNYAINSILFFAFFVLITQVRNHVTDVIEIKYLRWFGNISYSYFLIHGLAIKLTFFCVKYIIWPTNSYVSMYYLMLPITLVITILMSLSLYLVVEYPVSVRPNLNGLILSKSDVSEPVAS